MHERFLSQRHKDIQDSRTEQRQKHKCKNQGLHEQTVKTTRAFKGKPLSRKTHPAVKKLEGRTSFYLQGRDFSLYSPEVEERSFGVSPFEYSEEGMVGDRI